MTTRSARILDLIHGAWMSQAISAAASLGVADELGEGPRSVDELAAAVDADTQSLYRLLRALADVDIFEELEGQRFALTELGGLLRSDTPGSVRSFAMLVGSTAWRGAWTGLLDSVRTGESAFERVHGQGLFEYLRAHPKLAAVFDAALTGVSRQWIAAIVDAYHFGELKKVVDVGGGNGALLAAVLTANPGVHGVLFDRPDVVAGARRLFDDAGVSGRCEFVAGDFFVSVPPGGDAYLVSNVIHDWDDARAVQILARCRAAMSEGCRLLLGEMVPPGRGVPSLTKLLDLEMLVIGGRQRTEFEFDELFQRAGLRRSRVVPDGNGLYSIIEAVPA
jgi:hypothetical protein